MKTTTQTTKTTTQQPKTTSDDDFRSLMTDISEYRPTTTKDEGKEVDWRMTLVG